MAWKILRGALVASTEMVTFGVAARLADVNARRERNPETIESLIRFRPLVLSEMILQKQNYEL